MTEKSFFSELRKRKVVQTAAVYIAVAWGATEILVTVAEQLFLPAWVSTVVVIAFVVGFPVAMFLAWTFDVTPDGLQRATIGSRRGKASILVSGFLLIAGTTGLFFLIAPALEQRKNEIVDVSIVPNSIAVLPFENAGMDLDDLYLMGGLSDGLRDQLAGVSGLRIAARSSSVAAVAQGLDALTTADRLGVTNLLEGNVRRQGNLMRVSVQLINGSDGLTVWSETFERGPKEFLSLQQAIAEAVVSLILPGSEAIVAEPATSDPTANQFMLLAGHYEQQVRERQDGYETALLEAIRLYRKATEADPESALAHSRLAGTLLFLGDLDAANPPIFRALSLAPNLSEVQNTLGDYYWLRGLVNEAGVAYALAVEQGPDNPEALRNYALWHWKGTQVEEARELYWRALEIDRLNLERYAELGSFLALQSHWDEAHELILQVEELFTGPAANRVIGELWGYLGEVDKAIAWTIRARDLEPANSGHIERLAMYYADIGDFDTALKLHPAGIGILFKMGRYEEMIDLAEFAIIEEPDNLRLHSILAMAYNATGRYDFAIYLLGERELPKSMMRGARSSEETDGFGALMNAVYGAGDLELAQELAQIAVDYGKWDTHYWWINVPAACELLILGRDGEAREFLELAGKGVTLGGDPFLRDLPCFHRFKDDPIYQATVLHYEELKAMLRERLPATLAEFDVSL
jgi:TolB-like protein/Tfp pilus assembly protein PilF